MGRSKHNRIYTGGWSLGLFLRAVRRIMIVKMRS